MHLFGRNRDHDYYFKLLNEEANERPSGSVRGAPGNWCPYRDRQSTEAASVSECAASHASEDVS
jgi:hypothetical protein